MAVSPTAAAAAVVVAASTGAALTVVASPLPGLGCTGRALA
jgi:hypothetical protein